MNLEQFQVAYAKYRDIDKIEITCDHPLHEPVHELLTLGKQPARRNILKNGGKQFICKHCCMKHNNPMLRETNGNRQNSEEIVVFCPHPDHEGQPERVMKKASYYGAMSEPYLQVCKSCSQRGKLIPDEVRESIRMALAGVPKSEEFKQKIRDFWEAHPEHRERAIAVLLANKCTDGMLGKTHSEETKQKMSETMTGRVYTEEHKQHISEGRKAMLEETGGFTLEHRENLRRATFEQYKKGFDPKNHHISGWHESPKAGKVFYRSSYEKKAFLKLDENETVKTYVAEAISVTYPHPAKDGNSGYLIDLKIEYLDGSFKLVEIKPAKMLDNQIVIAKIEAGKTKAQELGMPFEVWTETDLFGPVYNPVHIKQFAQKLRNETPSQEEARKQKDAERRRKFYNKIKEAKITLFCDFCQTEHTVMQLTYDRNTVKNGRFICIKENGYLVGSTPRKKKENPYAAEGKKQCTVCKGILDFECFGSDSSRSDGYSNKCKECRKK